MIITIKNNSPGIRSYLGGFITVADSGQTVLSKDLNVVISGDAQFIFDCTSEAILLNNGSTDLSGPSALDLIKILSSFSTDPLATLFLYYYAPVDIRQTATTAADTTVWAMRNPLASPYSLVIENIYLKHGFDAGTPLGNKTLKYDFLRFNTATPTGGTPITPIKSSSIAPASAADVRFVDTGLSVTSVVFEADAFTCACPAVSGSISDFRHNIPMKLAPGEGLAIRLGVQATVGQSLAGIIVWSTR